MDIDKRTLEFKLDSIRQQFNVNRPSIIIVSHVSNVCGNIAPIEELGNIASSYNAKFIIDCAQSAGLLDIDIQKNKADYIIFAGHKTLYSSFGCSGFICRKDTSLQPLIVGGTGSESASEVMPKQIPDRFEAGTKNTIAIASLNASLKWIKEVGLENLYNKERESYVKLYELLRNYDFIRIVGKGKNTTSIISCSFVGLAPDNIANILGEHNIVIRAGLQCSPLAHKFLNTYPEGTVRFSVSYFTSEENLLKLKKVLEIIDEGI